MRKIVVSTVTVLAALSLALGCSSAPAAGSGAGALSATAAVQEFLAAARGGDVRMMAALFGTAAGPIANRDEPNDVEKRMRTLQCYLTHDAARVVDDLPAMGAGRQVTVELRRQTLVRRTTFSAVTGPRQRWFVESFDINAVTDLCRP